MRSAAPAIGFGQKAVRIVHNGIHPGVKDIIQECITRCNGIVVEGDHDEEKAPFAVVPGKTGDNIRTLAGSSLNWNPIQRFLDQNADSLNPDGSISSAPAVSPSILSTSTLYSGTRGKKLESRFIVKYTDVPTSTGRTRTPASGCNAEPILIRRRWPQLPTRSREQVPNRDNGVPFIEREAARQDGEAGNDLDHPPTQGMNGHTPTPPSPALSSDSDYSTVSELLSLDDLPGHMTPEASATFDILRYFGEEDEQWWNLPAFANVQPRYLKPPRGLTVRFYLCDGVVMLVKRELRLEGYKPVLDPTQASIVLVSAPPGATVTRPTDLQCLEMIRHMPGIVALSIEWFHRCYRARSLLPFDEFLVREAVIE